MHKVEKFIPPSALIEGTDKRGEVHTFRLELGAQRRISRRIRKLQLAGEMNPDLSALEALDSKEFGYVTVAECRIVNLKVPEDSFLPMFEDEEIMRICKSLWDGYSEAKEGKKESDEENPSLPDGDLSSLQSGTKSDIISGSGVDGRVSDSIPIGSGI